jgi:transcriptional regulator with XRE-family HTH domain
MTTTSTLLRAYRESMGLSQSEFARLVGMPIPTLQKIEQGQRRADDALLRFLLERSS